MFTTCFLSLLFAYFYAFIPVISGCILFESLDKKSILGYILAGTYCSKYTS